jgi:hypothetical protein
MLISLALFLTASVFASDLTCQKGDFRMPYDGSTKVISSQNYCYNKDRTELYSKDCQNHKCAAFNVDIKVTSSGIMDENSNPGFNLCRQLGGKPELLEFEASKEWFSLDRCLFKDGSYVNTSELIRHYLHR